jgi:protein TonB
MAGAPVDLGEFPPGPLTHEHVATSKTSKQVSQDEEVRAADVKPSPLAPKPEVLKPLQRQEEERQHLGKEAERAEQESRASAAQAPTAPPRLEEKIVAVPAAPAIGLSTATRQAQANWQTAVISHLYRYKRYPASARSHHIEGLVTVQFTVDRAGLVVTSQVLHSSGSQLLDDEAIAMLRRAAPLPVPPAQAQGAAIDLVLPIKFKIE